VTRSRDSSVRILNINTRVSRDRVPPYSNVPDILLANRHPETRLSIGGGGTIAQVEHKPPLPCQFTHVNKIGTL
jgi:hypothetical protein